MSSELVPAWGTGEIPASGAPDTVGAFRFICNPAHLAYDDPIVYPKQPGASHLHQFFGNTAVDANSTYQSLRTTGESTCMSPLNRSAYWMPAMMNGKGQVVRPDYVSVYYKRYPKSSPLCTSEGQGCVDLPRGLRFIFGYDMLTGKAPTGGFYYNCDGPTATPGSYPNIVEAAKNCPAGNKLGAVIHAPSCWDGLHLDSPNHRDHVAYPEFIGQSGKVSCPATHPYIIPHFSMGVWYTTDDDLDRSGTWSPGKATWHLSSDVMPGMAAMTPGSTFHSDWWGAWDDDVMQMWTDHCIDKLLNCSGGDLGNGQQMKMYADFAWTASPRIVGAPPR